MTIITQSSTETREMTANRVSVSLYLAWGFLHGRQLYGYYTPIYS
jgi:hypothetical protein